MNKSPKIAVIAGASGYLGQAISQKLSTAGYSVIAVDRSSGYDVTDQEALVTKAKEVSSLGNIAMIIYAASAPLVRKQLLTLSLEEFNSQLNVNLLGAYNFFKAFVPYLKSGSQLIAITTASLESGRALVKSGSYLPAKAGLRAMLRILATELVESGIEVTAIAPSFMPGGLNADLGTTGLAIISSNADLVMTTPEQVSELIVRLASRELAGAAGKSITVPGLVMTNL